MKKNVFFVLAFCLISYLTSAQKASVEKATFGIQTGYFGAWVYQEIKLSDNIALRTELGLDGEFWNSDPNTSTGFLFSPVISIEPRWYYNLGIRQGKSKVIAGNSGNFLALKTRLRPDWFLVSNRNNVSIVSDLSILPTWGIRRTIGEHFNYETGIGIGYVRYLNTDELSYTTQDKGGAAINIHLRIGYRF